jgi:hypothetical protein
MTVHRRTTARSILNATRNDASIVLDRKNLNVSAGGILYGKASSRRQRHRAALAIHADTSYVIPLSRKRSYGRLDGGNSVSVSDNVIHDPEQALLEATSRRSKLDCNRISWRSTSTVLQQFQTSRESRRNSKLLETKKHSIITTNKINAVEHVNHNRNSGNNHTTKNSSNWREMVLNKHPQFSSQPKKFERNILDVPLVAAPCNKNCVLSKIQSLSSLRMTSNDKIGKNKFLKLPSEITQQNSISNIPTLQKGAIVTTRTLIDLSCDEIDHDDNIEEEEEEELSADV